MQFEKLMQVQLQAHLAIFEGLSASFPELLSTAKVVAKALEEGRKLLVFGNGGSAADAQHLAAEFVNRFGRERNAYAAIALTTDTSVMTSIANDRAYDVVFARQIEALGQPGDVALGISTSGESKSVLSGLAVARARGLVTAALTGLGGEKLRGHVDHLLAVSASSTPRIQEAHIFLGHMMCDVVERIREGGTGMAGDRTAFVHPSSYVDGDVRVGDGTKIWLFCHIQKGARIGDDCVLGQNVNIDRDAIVGDRVKIQNNVSVYKGVVVEDDVFLGPSMVFTNVRNPRSHVSRKSEFQETRVCRGATIGANATIVCGNRVGAFAFVGAGTVVTKDIPPFALVVGNPARIRGWMCQCGVSLSFSGGLEDAGVARCGACGVVYDKEGTCVTMRAAG